MKKGLTAFIIATLFVGISIVAAQTLLQICIIVNSGAGTTFSGYTANYKYAGVEITPNQFYSNNPKKTRMKVSKKVNGSYVVKTTTTFTLSYACIIKGLGNVGTGTWKLGIYQYDANDNPYVGIDADLHFFSTSTNLP